MANAIRKTRPAQGRLGRRERRRSQTREKLFRTALRLFAKHGFFETTTEDITEAADVGQGTFFNYFPSKQHVLMALFELQLDRVQAARRAADSEQTSVKTVLRQLARSIGEEPGRSAALTRSLLIAFLSSDIVRESAARMLRAARKTLTGIMLVGQQRGELRQDAKASELAAVYQKRVLGSMLFFALQEGSLAAELDQMFKHFWAEAAAPAAKNRSRDAGH